MAIGTIDEVIIKNFFSMEELHLKDLKDKKEIYIVGENGDGKTLLLQAITMVFTGIVEGEVFNFIKSQKNFILKALDSLGHEQYVIENSHDFQFEFNIIAYGVSRNNYCQIKEDRVGYLTLFNSDYNLKNPVEWLQYLDYGEKSGKKNIINTENAKKLLKHLLNSAVEIDINRDEVTFTEKGSKIPFEQLSAGYKSVIIIICDLIARFSEKQQVENISDLEGIVLIDEVELHLHPKWKYNFMKKLRDTFPLIQFIVTTHSPTVILGASKEAVFYKIYKDDGKVQISNQIANEGYTHNSLVSSPLFDLESITSRDYDKSVSSSDYVYSKIHKVISERLKNDINIDENTLLKLIDKELDKL